MAEGTPSSEAARAGAPLKVEVLKLFPTPVVVATMRDAGSLNAELRRVILAREQTSESVERSNRGGWQSSWDMHEWGGAPMQKVLTFARAIVDDATVDRTGKRHSLSWRINCWANVHRSGHGNQFHTHPGALWSVSYYVDDGGIAVDGDDGAFQHLAFESVFSAEGFIKESGEALFRGGGIGGCFSHAVKSFRSCTIQAGRFTAGLPGTIPGGSSCRSLRSPGNGLGP